MQPPNEEFFTLFSEARSDIVERVAIPLAALPPRSAGQHPTLPGFGFGHPRCDYFCGADHAGD
jgi:hypothetical protein